MSQYHCSQALSNIDSLTPYVLAVVVVFKSVALTNTRHCVFSFFSRLCRLPVALARLALNGRIMCRNRWRWSTCRRRPEH